MGATGGSVPTAEDVWLFVAGVVLAAAIVAWRVMLEVQRASARVEAAQAATEAGQDDTWRQAQDVVRHAGRSETCAAATAAAESTSADSTREVRMRMLAVSMDTARALHRSDFDALQMVVNEPALHETAPLGQRPFCETPPLKDSAWCAVNPSI